MGRNTVLVLGAAGFIGRPLTARLAARGHRVIAATRQTAAFGPGVEPRTTAELDASTDWGSLIEGADAIVHLASRAHAAPAQGEAWITAEAGTARALATAAQRAGVRLIVLLSSVKAYGAAGHFRAGDPLRPADPYGRAKAAIEQAMADLRDSLVVLRPPLVYGPGVKANFRALLRLAAKGLPLPFASIDNRRSFIFLENLLDLIEIALGDSRALGHAFLLRDDRDISTADLLRVMRSAMGRPARLFPCPPSVLCGAAGLIGRREMADRLLDTLTVDDEATRRTLDWRPRVSLEDGIAATCGAFLSGAG
jgi:nucleoside-diphosphate-sugar epimerase